MRTASEYRQIAREKLKDNWGNAVVACLIVSLISGALSATGIGSIIAMFLVGALEVGLISFYLKLLNNEKAEIMDLFHNIGDDLISNFLAYLLQIIYI